MISPVIITSKLIGSTRNVWTTRLVTVISTIIFRVTPEAQRYTSAGFALELVATAGWFRAVLHLIAVIETVIVTIAHPRLGYTALIGASKVPGIGASEKRWLCVTIFNASFACNEGNKKIFNFSKTAYLRTL